MEHRFVVGQFVELTPNAVRVAALGDYEIRQTMPAPDVCSVSPRYRIKSAAELHDRIVSENELTLSGSLSQTVPASEMSLPRIDD